MFYNDGSMFFLYVIFGCVFFHW